jgi:hypothetical protein
MFSKITCLNFLSFALSIWGYGQSKFAGIYEGTFTRVDLKCDGMFSARFFPSTDTITIFGKWSQEEKKLRLSVDSSQPKSFGEQRRIIKLKIKDNFLYPSQITRSEYRDLKRAAKSEYHPRKVKPYSEYKKMNVERLASDNGIFILPVIGYLKKPSSSTSIILNKDIY